MALTGPSRTAPRPARGPRRRRRGAGRVLPRPRCARLAGRAGRPHGSVAPRHDELRRELPSLALPRRVRGRVARHATTTSRPCRPGSNSTTRRPTGAGGLVRRRRGGGPPRHRRAAGAGGSLGAAGGAGRRGDRQAGRGPGARSAPPRRASSAGLLVVDLSALWAGPLCGDLLAAAGAAVIKVESTSRPDGARRGPAAFFDLLNGRKRSVALDFQSDAGIAALRAARVRRADVVLEASRPRALEQLGISAGDEVAGGGPRSGSPSPATGAPATAGEPGRLRRRRRRGRRPGRLARRGTAMFCADAVADPLSGLAAAAPASTRSPRADAGSSTCPWRPCVPGSRVRRARVRGGAGRAPPRARPGRRGPRPSSAPTRRRCWPSSASNVRSRRPSAWINAAETIVRRAPARPAQGEALSWQTSWKGFASSRWPNRPSSRRRPPSWRTGAPRSSRSNTPSGATPCAAWPPAASCRRWARCTCCWSTPTGARRASASTSDPQGLDLIYRLAATSDVFLTNKLPAVRKKLKIEFEDLRAAQPQHHLRGRDRRRRARPRGRSRRLRLPELLVPGGQRHGHTPTDVDYLCRPAGPGVRRLHRRHDDRRRDPGRALPPRAHG